MPSICEPGGGGLLLPLIDGEQSWPKAPRAVMYLVGLLYCFLGVSIIADVFMAAIEEVTSKRKRVRISKQDDRFVTVKVWNDTIANLSLMALGSSAPEILLAVIELLGAAWFSGDLGPSTIVGSAAFNLLVIIAICVWVIPPGELRVVKETKVFYVTATFSVFAYVWILVILIFSSPNVIDIWEGVMTFMFFPILLVIAFLADRGYFGKEVSDDPVVDGDTKGCKLTQDELDQAAKAVEARRGTHMLPQEVQDMLDHKAMQSGTKGPSRATRRCEATRELTAGKRIKSEAPEKISEEEESFDVNIGFRACLWEVNSATCNDLAITVIREGVTECAVEIHYMTVDGTCKANEEFQTAEGVLTFAEGEESKDIVINLKKTDKPHLGTFDVTLDHPRLCSGDNSYAVHLTRRNCAHVMMVPHEGAGFIVWPKDEITVAGNESSQKVDVTVLRQRGSQGSITCKYKSERVTAIPGFDYVDSEGEVEFQACQAEFNLVLEILPKAKTERDDVFRVILEEPTGGGEFDPERDGGPECSILTVHIANSHEATFGQNIVKWFDALFNFDECKLGSSDWGEQWRAAIYCNGSAEDQKEASAGDWAIHMLALPWKLFFSLVPPTTYFGGWLCFNIALVFIGATTALIGDLAALLGCVLGIPDSITAITFVALGTSLPDTFASKKSACEDETADASVGNVTGSNSVNVFLGLGVPWIACAMYWELGGATDKWRLTTPQSVQDYVNNKDNAVYALPADDLGFSVGVFVACAICAMAALSLRRFLFKGELGGPHIPKLVSAFYLVFLWFVYIAASWSYIEVTSD